MLARFERLMEQAVEGSLRRVFPTQLQPVQIAKAAARAMEDAQVVGIAGVEVPNRYEVRLSPEDLERFGDYRPTLVRGLEKYLADYAADRGLRPVGPTQVDVDGDSSIRPGSLRVRARFVDITPERQAALEEAVEGTRALRLAPLAANRTPAPTALDLVEADGRRVRLDPEQGVVRIGRALDNDVVLVDSRVSRYHAQLRWDGQRWQAWDLQSTNGTFVGQRRLEGEPVALAPGTTLQLGEYRLGVAAAPERDG